MHIAKISNLDMLVMLCNVVQFNKKIKMHESYETTVPYIYICMYKSDEATVS